MKKLRSLAILAPLLWCSIASYSQGIRIQPRWLEEAIVKDLVRYDGCRADRATLESKISDYQAIVQTHEGKEVLLEKIITEMKGQAGDYQAIIKENDGTIAKIRKQKGWLWLSVAAEAIIIILLL